MQDDFLANPEEFARNRNLRIMITKELAHRGYDKNETYNIPKIKERFFFCERDIKYRLVDFFEPAAELYVLNAKTRRFVEKTLKAHKLALSSLQEAEVIFLKIFGRFYEQSKENYLNFDHERLQCIFDGLHDIIPILHWGRLPILNKYLMINSGKIPEDDVVNFYNHYDMLKAMLKDIQGDSEIMTTKGDETLNREMNFSVYTRRWGHCDNYSVKRTVDGWYVGHLSINGVCDKDGTSALLGNLDHDSVFYPEDGVKYAMVELWEQADEGKLTPEELQDRLQQIADWISTVERAVGKGQPDWVNYY